ncbi:hypothetical protein EDB86DRAFT_1080665 [Lactarius hatsudake]|nr:hypothetical protein EDB86DRAFT_1080665 [Lactarius hatsudake]
MSLLLYVLPRPVFLVSPPNAHPLDCCWSSLVARRCPLACLWLLAPMAPSLFTCTFIVAPASPLQADLPYAYFCLSCHRVHQHTHSSPCLVFPALVLAVNIYNVAVVLPNLVYMDTQPLRLISRIAQFNVLPLFLELCPNLFCFFFSFLWHTQAKPPPQVIPYISVRSLSRI